MKRNQIGKNNPNWRGGLTSKQYYCKLCCSPISYQSGHKVTGLCRKCGKIGAKSINNSDSNGMWRGDKVGYYALHIWVSNRKPKPKACPRCHKKKRLELANISQEYKRDVKDYEWLCRKCHMEKDGRLKKLKDRIIKQNLTANPMKARK